MPGLEGKTLNRYELRTLIGRGGMADVYEGYDTFTGRIVAVKVFKREDEEMLRRFIREAQFMSSLHNDHLVPIYDSGECLVDGYARYYIVMPYMEGGTLRARIRRSPLSLQEACRHLQDIADALDYIHRQGIVHRDIKSSNVLLDAQGRCYLSDFGIARTLADSTQLTTAGSVLGTVDYVAPELFQEANRKANDRSDLYSLGVLLFEMVTGRLPFSAENQIALVAMHMNMPPPAPSSIVPHIPPQVDRVILQALEKRPELRYGSATELANAFCQAIAAADIGPIPEHYHDARYAPGTAVPIGGAKQIVLPPVAPAAKAPAIVQPHPSLLNNASGAEPYVPPHPASPPAEPLAPSQPRRAPAMGVTGIRKPPARSRFATRQFWSAALIAFLTLAIIIGFSIYAVLSHPNSGPNPPGTPQVLPQHTETVSATQAPTATPNLTATAQAQQAATATAQANATASAVASATAAAQANATATAGVIQTATSGTPAYQDPLNNPNNPATQRAQWDGLDGSNSQCVFSSDGYHVKESSGLVNLQGCRETGYTYKNAAVSVNVTILKGHSGGLFFRLSTDAFGFYEGYLFEIDSQGHYKISLVGGGGSVTALQDWTSSSALKQGYGVPNTLQLIMRDNTFLFYANGVFLVSLSDSTYSSAGDIGFLATTNSSAPSADILYSNLNVYPQS